MMIDLMTMSPTLTSIVLSKSS